MSKGKARGFLTYNRQTAAERPFDERIEVREEEHQADTDDDNQRCDHANDQFSGFTHGLAPRVAAGRRAYATTIGTRVKPSQAAAKRGRGASPFLPSLERATRFELATYTLARYRSTN